MSNFHQLDNVHPLHFGLSLVDFDHQCGAICLRFSLAPF
jgi:hypothetical protein